MNHLEVCLCLCLPESTRCLLNRALVAIIPCKKWLIAGQNYRRWELPELQSFVLILFSSALSLFVKMTKSTNPTDDTGETSGAPSFDFELCAHKVDS